MTRRYPRRLLAASLSTVLVALTMLAAPAFAGNTRQVYIGDPGGIIAYDGNGNEMVGTLTYTRTSPGGLSAVDIQVRNDGSQTINHANLYGGYAADQAVENPLFPKPSGSSLPTGLTFAAAYPLSICTIGPDGSGTPGRSLSCDLGQLAGYSSVQVRVVVATSGTDANTWATWYGAYLSETNSTGSNQDNFYATGSISTSKPTCSADPDSNKDANYFLPSSLVSLATSSCSDAGVIQSASVSSGRSVGGNGVYGEVSLSSIGSLCTDVGLTCYGDAIVADIADGQPVAGGLQFTATWYGTRSLSGVVHFFDTYIAGDPVHGSDYFIILFKQSSKCGKNLTTNCWTVTSSSKGNDPTGPWFSATWVQPDNGRGVGAY